MDGDQRDVELSSLEAIYPELQRVDPNDPYKIFLEVPVNPAKGVLVTFPNPTTDGAVPADGAAANGAGVGDNHHGGADGGLAIDPDRNPNNGPDSHRLSHLPPVRLEIELGSGYPEEKPPNVSVSTNPPWLPATVVHRLKEDGPRLWEDIGRDMVVYTYIDHVQQAAEDLFGLVEEKEGLEVDTQHKIAVLDYDIKAKKAAFDRETFSCGVCLDPKKGSVCHRMVDCGHVFCVDCLQDFYNNAVKEGDLATVRCLAPGCAKEREKAAAAEKKGKKVRTFISPSELLQIPLEPEVVQRYVTLKYKTELESDKNTIYCPRSWCNGAARSKKHKKPDGFELGEASDDEGSEGEDEAGPGGKVKPYKPEKELLAICEDCGFAFCSRCQQSWHGEFVRCSAPRKKGELTEEDIASLEYVKLHTTPCPTCAAPVQKTHGCNHMLCYRCQSHFCYLCSAWLAPDNPYQHFNQQPDGKRTSCYMRLWELEEGDGDDVGLGFAGGRGGGAPAGGAPIPVEPVVPQMEEPEDGDEVQEPAGRDRQRDNHEAHGADDARVGVAREGPLVLRIAGNPPAGAGRGGPRVAGVPPRAPVPPARGGQNQQHPLAGQAGPARGGRGGGGAAARRGGGRGAAQYAGQNNRAGGRGGAQQRNGGMAAQGVQLFGPILEMMRADALPARLDAPQEAWVRQFVQLALEDREDLLAEMEQDVGFR